VRTQFSKCSAQAEIHLAYYTEQPDTIRAVFPSGHQALQWISVVPIVANDELIAASVGSAKNGDAFLRIQVTEPARARIDQIARANIRTLNSHASDDIADLAITVDGKVLDVISAVHPLSATTFSIWSMPTSEATIRTWQSIADAVKRPKKPASSFGSDGDGQL
jgi:hypothetical protein